MIDERIASMATGRLAAVAPKHWPQATAEVQDGGKFLLLSVHLATSDGADLKAAERDVIVNTLNAIIPTSSEQQLGSWMVVVLNGCNVEESILPNGV